MSELERLNQEQDEALAEMHRLTREYREAHDAAFKRYKAASERYSAVLYEEFPELRDAKPEASDS